MEKYVGVWIDHRQAIIVSVVNKKEIVTTIKSDAEGHFRSTGGSRSASFQGEIVSGRKAEARRTHQLRNYYDEVISLLHDAHSIYIFGPGEAKKELETEMKKSKALASKVVETTPADKMTENQIVAEVKKHFITEE
ncbi:MAG: hypothetical protein JXB42_08645 [Deltaproteobacteria bacterium]|nr:hypothetical protein [Deltaproteobacteria bacterium]